MRARPAERVWVNLLGPDEAQTFDDVARLSGLEPLGRGWIEVDRPRALAFLNALLHKDLAYKAEVLPARRALWLAERFLGSFGEYGSRYATNSPDMPHQTPFAWTPATDHTFDAGIAVLGKTGAGLFWVADED